jgi:putative hydrolase of the HAD superfamily
MTNSHPVILGIKAERTGVLRYLDAAYTSHGFGAPKEDQKFWIAARQAEPFDPARTMFVDDSKAVLHAAIEAGVRWVYGVKRPDTSREPHNHEEFSAIDGVVDLL